MVSITVDSQKLEYGHRTCCVGFPSFFGLSLKYSHIPIFWLLP